MCLTEKLQDEVLEEVTSSGIERREVNQEVLPIPLCSMPSEADKPLVLRDA